MDRRSFLAIALAAAPALGQVSPTVKGSAEDLRGATRIYVDADYDRALAEQLAAEIRRELPELTIVAEAKEADLVVRFSRSVADGGRGVSDEPPFSADQTMPREPPRPRARAPLPATTAAGAEPEAPSAFDRPDRYAFGSVLKRAPSGPMREAVSFKQPIRTRNDTAARDFVRKFAREYRRANP
jgi:hypothetical protein